MLTVVTETTPGAVRANNEDSLLWDPEIGLIAVADGMGGHNAGEVASHLALETLQKFLRQASGEETSQRPPGHEGRLIPNANQLRTAIKLANHDVLHVSGERPECAGMGTTLTVALVDGPHIFFSSVGDSRLYSYVRSSGEFLQRTRDDSLVGILAETPGIDVAKLGDHPMKHLLTSVIGRRPELEVTIDEMTLTDGEILLLCSDGMHGSVSDDAMRAVLDAEADLQKAADTLVNMALDGGSRDNISVVIARYVV
jgi:protein phosphatase